MPFYSSYDSDTGLSWVGMGGFIAALAAFVVMALISGPDVPVAACPGGGSGVCFPSPSHWIADARLSMWLNVGLIVACAFYSVALTKHFNFLPSGNMLYGTALLLMSGAAPWITSGLNGGVVVLLVVLVCVNLLFPLYGRRNGSEGIFLIFSFLSWGSMFQYAFVGLMPVFLLGAVFLRSLRLREAVAMLLGVLAPYWIMMATGVVSVEDLRIPSLNSVFSLTAVPFELFHFLLATAITVLLFLAVWIVNTTRHGSAGVKVRARWSFIILLGFALVVFMLIDFANAPAYLPAFYLCTGYMCALRSSKLKSTSRLYVALSLFGVYLLLFAVFTVV